MREEIKVGKMVLVIDGGKVSCFDPNEVSPKGIVPPSVREKLDGSNYSPEKQWTIDGIPVGTYRQSTVASVKVEQQKDVKKKSTVVEVLKAGATLLAGIISLLLMFFILPLGVLGLLCVLAIFNKKGVT